MTVRGRTRPRRITAWAAVVLLAVAGLVLAGPASPAAAATAVQPPVPAGGVVRVTGKGGAYSTVWGNLTITQPAGAGWAVAFGCDQPRPLSSNVNFAAGQTVAAFVAVRTDALGAFCIYTAASAHVVFDQVAASPVLPVAAPVRKLDTRLPQFGASILPDGGVVSVVSGGAPFATVWGNLTITQAVGAGFAVAYPCDGPRPLASNVNYLAGRSVANFVAVRTDAAGVFCIFTSAAAHVVFDQVAASAVLPVGTPVRMVDTREAVFGGAPLPGAGVLRVAAGAAPGATVWGNLTITRPAGGGYAVAFPCDQARPVTSSLNFAQGQTVANFVAVRADARGDICVYTTTAAHVVFDQVAASAVLPVAVPNRVSDSRQHWTGASQVVTVRTATATSTRAQVTLWQRGSNGQFTVVRGPVSGWVGELGVGTGQWGVPRTPQGVFTLTQSFGILANPGTRMPYFKVDELDWWDGDTTSPTYNQHVRKSYVPGAGSEHLIDFGLPYYYAVAMDYNLEQIPSKGSAFFFHVSSNEPTGGCVSAPLTDFRAMLQAMDPNQNPVISIGVGGWGTALVDRTYWS